jgi:hypothetical protein
LKIDLILDMLAFWRAVAVFLTASSLYAQAGIAVTVPKGKKVAAKIYFP